MVNVIILNNINDINFSMIAQKASVTGATLPSGLKVPNSGNWIIIDNYIVNIEYLEIPTNLPN